MAKKVCFFCKINDPKLLRIVGFYKQDLEFLESAGYEVVIATSWKEIPWDADLYFVWWWSYAFQPILKAKLRGRPVLITGVFDYKWPIPGSDYFSRPWHQRALLRFALRFSDANTLTSTYEYELMAKELNVTRPMMIPLTVDPNVFTPSDTPRENFALTIASMEAPSVYRKSLMTIVESIPAVLKKNPGIKFLFVGRQGSGFGDMKRRVAELGIEHAVEFPGIVSDAEKVSLLQRCRVYLQPSRFEGFGLALLEALSCGAPSISSPVGSIPEVMAETGLYAKGDDPADLANTINKILGDPALAADLAKKGRAHVLKNFTPERRAKPLLALVEDLMARK